MIDRRHFLTTAGATLALPLIARRAAALNLGDVARLEMPPLLDTTRTGRLNLTAMKGQHDYGTGTASTTAGFGQSYLGPTIRMRNGPVAAEIENRMAEDISVHWHGLIVPGIHDGGPHQPIAPGASWTPDLQIAQDPATLWYHSHIHGRTAPQVYSGLAGLIQLTDDRDDQRGLPSDYGTDDLTLILQDRRFDAAGRVLYQPRMMDVMHGFVGNAMTVNGQTNALAVVPGGIARLRLLNGSNARIYSLHFEDGRPLHLIATDAGLLPAPTALDVLTLAPGERAEILVDFSDGRAATLLSDPGREFVVQDFVVDDGLPARISRLPDSFDSPPDDLTETDAPVRSFTLDMGMGMGRGMGGMMAGGFGINRQSYDMARIDFEVPLGAVERWIIRSSMMAHPFHVHGAKFRVVRENGAPPAAQNAGWKDTVLVGTETEIVARFDQPASRDKPFMFHCHILEHEDAGMMGQFAVI